MGSLVLIRHATTEASAGGRNLGQRSDPALAPEGLVLGERVGRALAAELASLRPDELRLLTSPARRCRQTLEALLPGIGAAGSSIEVASELREIDYGGWEGLTADECRRQDPELRAAWEADPHATACPGGESGADVAARSFPVLADVEAWLAGGSGRVALVVSHNHVVRLRLTALIGIPLAKYRRVLSADPGGYSIVTFGGSHPVIRRLNCLPPPSPGSASA
jgi:alpha-ribazole phosphatase